MAQTHGAEQLAALGERLRLECALCGRLLWLADLDGHIAAHAAADECLSFAAFAGRCASNVLLEGLPALDAAGREVVWPFELVSPGAAAVLPELAAPAHA